MKLIYTATRQPVQVGDKVRDFRGDEHTVTGMGYPPRHSGSSGRIELDGFQYFPSVAGAEWEESQ